MRLHAHHLSFKVERVRRDFAHGGLEHGVRSLPVDWRAAAKEADGWSSRKGSAAAARFHFTILEPVRNVPLVCFEHVTSIFECEPEPVRNAFTVCMHAVLAPDRNGAMVCLERVTAVLYVSCAG